MTKEQSEESVWVPKGIGKGDVPFHFIDETDPCFASLVAIHHDVTIMDTMNWLGCDRETAEIVTALAISKIMGDETVL